MKTILKKTITLQILILVAASLQAQPNITLTEFGFSIGENNSKLFVTATGDSLFMNRAMNHQISESDLFPHAVEVCTMTGIIRDRKSILVSCSCIRTDDDGDEILGFCQPRDLDGQLPVLYTGGTGKYEGLSCNGLTGLNQESHQGLSYTWTFDTQLTCKRE